MVSELVEKLDFDLLYQKPSYIVGRRNLNIMEDLLNKSIQYFKPEKKEAVIEVEEEKEESLLTDEDKEDILHVIDPLLAKALVSTPVAKAKPKFSYLTALFYSNVYKNYHEKRLVTIAVERYKWIKSTIENNNKEIEDCTKRIEELKEQNEAFKHKNSRILVGYTPEEVEAVKKEIDLINFRQQQRSSN